MVPGIDFNMILVFIQAPMVRGRGVGAWQHVLGPAFHASPKKHPNSLCLDGYIGIYRDRLGCIWIYRRNGKEQKKNREN